MTNQHKKFREECKRRWKKEVYDKIDEVDPEEYYVWEDVAMGFFIGCGCSVESAIELLQEIQF